MLRTHVSIFLVIFAAIFPRHIKANCIGVESSNAAFCSYCSSGFYREKFYAYRPQSSSSVRTSSEPFPISECITKETTDPNSCNLTIYDSNIQCGLPACDGTLANPFDNIISGILFLFFLSLERNIYITT